MSIRHILCLSQIGFPRCSDINLTSEESLCALVRSGKHNQIINDSRFVGIGQVGLINKPNNQRMCFGELRNTNLCTNKVINRVNIRLCDDTITAIREVGDIRHNHINSCILKLTRQECGTIDSITSSIQRLCDNRIA